MRVRLHRYAIPIEFLGDGVTVFILVPFFGACVHVPCPTPNQLVSVTIQNPYHSKGMYQPFHIIGIFSTATTTTELAEIGYSLSADLIEVDRP